MNWDAGTISGIGSGPSGVIAANNEIAARMSGVGSTAFSTRVEGTDTASWAFSIGNRGHHDWGSGAALSDVGFGRISPDTLAMDADDKFNMPYVITFLTDSPDLLTNKRYVDERDAYVESTAKRFAFFITP